MPQDRNIDPIFVENLKEALREQKRSAYSVAKALGKSPNWLYLILKKQKGISFAMVRAIASELNMQARDLMDTPDDIGGAITNPSAYVAVAQERVMAGIRGGNISLAIEGPMPFRRYRLAEEGINPNLARIYRVEGDSMLPTLPHGSYLLVDYQSKKIREGRMYVFRTNGDLFVKRARRRDSVCYWYSDNDSPQWPPIAWEDSMRVIGQVRWYCSDYLR